jgi:hypothetical protein
MSWDLIQHIAVTLVAVVAAGVLCRQVLVLVWPRRQQQPACANCPSARQSKRARPASAPGETVILQIRK